jgi:general secretion pathway protein B
MDHEFGALAPVIMEAPEVPAAAGSAPGPPTAPVDTPAPALPQAALPAAPIAGSPKAGAPSRIVSGNELPTAEQLIGSGALNIPILNLDLHVYSDKPAARFVVINSRKYKEGGQLTEGPTVDSITKDGVILVNQGRRFTLSRK